jgi:hypothetical protein
MGYENRLFIGRSCHSSDELRQEDLIISDGEAYRPYSRDDDGNTVPTGRKGIYFQVMAMIDLCKCGYDSEISKIDWKNKEMESVFWYFYYGSEETKEDHYGETPKPVIIKTVLDALRKDSEREDYRRFKWAIALLESMEKDSENLQVLFYGY